MSPLSLVTEDDLHIVITRRFAAPREMVFRAHTEPGLIQQWLLGPDGWSMPVCRVDLRPGGHFRYEWTNDRGAGFHITGEFIEVVPSSRIVHVERMHLPDPTPDNHIVTSFTKDGTGTLLTLRMTLPDEKTRSTILASGMERGLEASYVRLAGLI
jgi:uncharacterized protein YndB with AHSA1/START domain